MIDTMMKKCSWCNTDSGLLVLRIGVGAIFIMTGWMKVSDLSATVGFFATLGFSAFWAYLVTAVELLGGIAVLLGIYSRVATILLSIVMIVATYELFPNLQVAQLPLLQYVLKGIQLAMTPISMLASTIALTLAGSGKYSIKE